MLEKVLFCYSTGMSCIVTFGVMTVLIFFGGNGYIGGIAGWGFFFLFFGSVFLVNLFFGGFCEESSQNPCLFVFLGVLFV